MFIPHETFSLWLFLSVGIHVATLALWPLPSSWTVEQPSYVVVDLRPAGGRTADTSIIAGKNLDTPPALVNQTAPSQPAMHKPAISPAKRNVVKKASKSSVIPAPTPLPTELSTKPENSSEQVAVPAQGSTHEFDGTINGERTDGTEAASNKPAGGLGGASDSDNNGIPGSGTGGPGTGQGMLRATPLAYGENPPMPYPHSARRRGWEGEVLLRVDVSAKGNVIAAHIETSSGYGILDDTALKNVSTWRFRPASINGTPKADTVLVPVHFQLHSPQ